MKKAVILIVTLLAIVATAAFSAGGGEGGAPKPVTLMFSLKNTSTTAPYEAIFAKYQEKSGNKVEIQALAAGEEYGQLMLTRFATNDYPDLFEMDPGTKQYIKFRAEDTLHEWTNSPVARLMTDSMREFQTLDGKVYGIPWGSTGNLGVYYNKDVFRRVGVSPPEDFNEFLEICGKIKAAGVTPVYEAVQTGWPTQIFSLAGWVSYVDPAIGDAGVQNIEVNKLRLNQIPEFKRVLQAQYSLKTMGFYQNNVLAGTYEEQQDAIGTGKAAMIFQGAWVLNLLADKFGDDFVNSKIGWFPVPAEDGPGVACLYAAGQILVPKLTDHLTAAIGLVEFMTTPDMLDLWYSYNPGIPVYTNATSDLYTAQEETFRWVQEGKAKINVQNRLSSSFTDYPKILQQLFIDGKVDAALNQLDENFRRTGKARQLPGF